MPSVRMNEIKLNSLCESTLLTATVHLIRSCKNRILIQTSLWLCMLSCSMWFISATPSVTTSDNSSMTQLLHDLKNPREKRKSCINYSSFKKKKKRLFAIYFKTQHVPHAKFNYLFSSHLKVFLHLCWIVIIQLGTALFLFVFFHRHTFLLESQWTFHVLCALCRRLRRGPLHDSPGVDARAADVWGRGVDALHPRGS